MSDPRAKRSTSTSRTPSPLPSAHAAACRPGRVRWRTAALLALALLALAPGCRDGGGGARDEKSSGMRRYTVRGEVVRLSEGSTGARQVGLRHEAIDDFVNQAGKTVGMGSMVMSFEAAPGVSLEDVRVGDKVEVQLAVGWSPPTLRIEQLRKLPAGTALEFREARPTATP